MVFALQKSMHFGWPAQIAHFHVECDVDSELLTTAHAKLVLRYATQVLRSKSDISESEVVKAAAKIFETRRLHFRRVRRPV